MSARVKMSTRPHARSAATREKSRRQGLGPAAASPVRNHNCVPMWSRPKNGGSYLLKGRASRPSNQSITSNSIPRLSIPASRSAYPGPLIWVRRPGAPPSHQRSKAPLTAAYIIVRLSFVKA
jgi:hypothetical protein